MQPTDLQVANDKSKVRDVVAIHPVGYDLKYKPEVDSVVVVHPVEHDLRSAIPASRHVACHLVLRWQKLSGSGG